MKIPENLRRLCDKHPPSYYISLGDDAIMVFEVANRKTVTAVMFKDGEYVGTCVSSKYGFSVIDMLLDEACFKLDQDFLNDDGHRLSDIHVGGNYYRRA